MALKDHRYYEDEDEPKSVKPGHKKFTEFDCPGCNANNPVDEITHKSRVMCNYCGMEWEVRIDDEGRMDLREC